MRKSSRWSYGSVEYSEHMDPSASADPAKLKLVEGRNAGAFRTWVSKNESALIRHWQSKLGVDISNHRPEDLEVVDRLLNARFHRFAHETQRTYEANIIAVGCYLGEVIVRNLGGRWHPPNSLQVVILLARRNPIRAERQAYVLLGRKKVFVFQAAREAIDKTGAVFSLREFYKGWAAIAPGN